MAHIWAVRETDGNWTHYLDDNGVILHVVHGKDGQGDLDVGDYEVRPINRSGFNKLQMTNAYVKRLGLHDEGGGKLAHDGTYVYDR